MQRAVGDLREGTVDRCATSPRRERERATRRWPSVLRDAVEAHRQEPEADLEAMLGVNYVRVPLARVRELLDAAWTEAPSWDGRRERLRMDLLRDFYREYGSKLGAGAMRSFEELEKALAKDGYLKGFVDRILPPLVPERVLVEALGLARRPRAGRTPTSPCSTSSTS